MTITLPKKLESQLIRLFPTREEQEAFLSRVVTGALKVEETLVSRRTPEDEALLEEAYVRAAWIKDEPDEETYSRFRDLLIKVNS
jgi:hypothetical protein